jgi:RHS repeat-associated protein
VVLHTESIGATTRTRCYGYDAAGRLESVSDAFDAGAKACTGLLLEAYSYDANDNRVSAINSAGIVDGAEVVVDEQDRLLEYGGLRYSYTENGELDIKEDSSTGDVWDFDYDAAGNLVGVELPSGDLIEYVLDARNRRIGKKVNGVLAQGLLYEGQLDPVAELDSSGNLVSRFVYASRVNVPDYMVRDGEAYRLLSDHLGSVVAVVEVDSGQVVQRIQYDTWGRVLLDTNPGFQPFGFAGGLWDADTGLLRFGARDYDPETGRWTSRDPLAFAGGGTNLFAYALNSPVQLIDPAGITPLMTPFASRYGFFQDIFQRLHDLGETLADFWYNYEQMKDAAHKGGDKYFHCLANCQASRSGPHGADYAEFFSEGREFFDENFKGDPPSACDEDRDANFRGREGDPDQSCPQVCDPLRPPKLPGRF